MIDGARRFVRIIHCETEVLQTSPPSFRADHTRVKQGPVTNLGDWGPPPARLGAGSPIRRSRWFRPPPPVRLRAEPLSHRLPLQGGVIEASTRLPVELNYSPLEGESQKPSRRRRLMRRGAIATPQSSAGWRRLMRWGARLDSGPCDGAADTGRNSGASDKMRNVSIK